MAKELSRKRKLSKALLEMKFMKSTKDKVDQEEEIEESSELFSDKITEEMKSGANNAVIERSLARCKGLTDGRLSYQGMNPEIERLMSLRMPKNDITVREEDNVDVTDLEMASYNLLLNQSIAKRFKTKNQAKLKKPTFMKPDD